MPQDMDESASSADSGSVTARPVLPPSVLASGPAEEAAAERPQQARMHEAMRRTRLSVN